MTLRKILLIDDEVDLRRSGALSLRNVGKWPLTLAESGRAALGLVERERPDGRLPIAALRRCRSSISGPTIFCSWTFRCPRWTGSRRAAHSSAQAHPAAADHRHDRHRHG